MRHTARAITDTTGTSRDYPPVLVVDQDLRFAEAVRVRLAEGHLVNPVLTCPDPDIAHRHLTGRIRSATDRAIAVVVSFDFEARQGQRLLRTIGRSPSMGGVPVVVVGQGVDPDEVKEAIDLGAAAYLSKLVASHVLLDIIRGFGMPWALADPAPAAGAG